MRGGIITDFEFEKCEDVVVRVESEILGGVVQAVCTQTQSLYEINEFLTDKPVYTNTCSKHKIKLNMISGQDNPFVNQSCFDCVELLFKDRTERFFDCCVEKLERKINARGNIELEILLTTEKRDLCE